MSAPYDVQPADEVRHAPDADDLWNESYYCDFVQGDGSWGGWLRLGLYPNRQVAWWTAWVVRPGEPGICSVDYRAPVPPGGTLVSESESVGRVEVDIRRPLEEFRLSVDSPAVTLAKPSDAYRDKSGKSTRLSTDLTWFTDGVPYHYTLTTRYEIPCTVRGSVTIDGETLEVDGHGQRDHSWGVRDWWAFGWCWCSLRLDDGTRVHLADIRIPGMPSFFGYVQYQGVVAPLRALSVTEELVQHGFPSKARIELTAGPLDNAQPTALGLDVTPTAFGPVLLCNDDGRTSRFPRALLECRTDDGRTGTGWIEWNQPEVPG
ncbi:MAG TPA: hypothetical protein VK773_10635 [Acidimicrobiales bacterium]|jgi:hypothetical protein|nr:hypothetical protein [Acidimicrobiales bacterium]